MYYIYGHVWAIPTYRVYRLYDKQVRFPLAPLHTRYHVVFDTPGLQNRLHTLFTVYMWFVLAPLKL